MTRGTLVVLVVLLALTATPAPAYAGGIVSVCDEAHLLAALAGGGIVTFSCSGTITLSATIIIAADTTIDGSGQTIVISGNHVVRVFAVDPGIAFNLNQVTITDGKSEPQGGGIINFGGTVGVSNSIFSANSGGIVNTLHGTVTVNNSIFTGNTAPSSGGGILNDNGTVIVSNSTFSGNSATYGGGGISSYGTDSALAVSGTTFSGNHGGSFTSGGGGIYNNRGTVMVSNSTFAENTANDGGGIYSIAEYSGVTVSNSTFAENSATSGAATIANRDNGHFTLNNTIVANRPGRINCAGPITDGGGNLSYPDTTCPGINGDPLLGPLRDNGGPTYTMALRWGSAALDAGDDDTCAAAPVNNLDQRGMTRPDGPHCDIGAFEGKLLPTFLPLIMR